MVPGGYLGWFHWHENCPEVRDPTDFKYFQGSGGSHISGSIRFHTVPFLPLDTSDFMCYIGIHMSKLALSPTLLVERMATVERELSLRKTHLQIEREQAKLWKCSTQEVREVITAVQNRWKDEAKGDRREDRRDAIRAAFDALYQHAFAKGDLKTARGCLQDLIALDNLSNTTEPGTPPLPLVIQTASSPLDIRNQIREMEEARRKTLNAPQEYHVEPEKPEEG